MPPVGFEPTISAGERPQTYALDGAANGTGTLVVLSVFYLRIYVLFSVMSLVNSNSGIP